MNPLSFDSETALIRPGLLAPPLVCVSWQRPGHEARLDHVHGVEPRLRSWLTDSSTLLVGHFVAYDAAVICAEFPDLVPLVFNAYRTNRVTCTKKRQQLLDIAGGVFRGRPGEKGRWITHEYTLDALSRRHLGKPMVKDGWRLRYGELRDVPLAKWPEWAREWQERARQRREEIAALAQARGEAASLPGIYFTSSEEKELKSLDAIIADVPEGVIRYPLNDAEATLGVYISQEKHREYLADQYRQAYADFVLYLSSVWGLRTHGPGVEALKAELEEAHKELEGELVELGLVRENGTRDMKVVKRLMIDTCAANGLSLRRTDGHLKCDLGDACEEHVSLDSDACEAVAAVDEHGTLARYAEFVTLGKMLSNDVKMLESGITYPVHTRYDLAETGRTTSSGPNIQNLNTGRVKNKNSIAQRLRPGVRQAFIPRPGMVYAQADFPQLELYTLAQCCYSWLGFSELGEALNRGLDPHLAVAAKIVGVSYEEAAANKKRHDVDHARQVGKVFNFGKPGGLGTNKLILFARKTYGVTLTKEQVESYTAQWHEAFPEMRQYFARINAMFGEDNERASVESLFTKRIRGGATYCAACNNGFQGLGADCAKRALTLVAEAQYCDSSSPLYGSRAVAFVHDEVICETPDTSNAHDAAMALAALMVKGANEYLPNVPIPLSKMEPTLMRVWSKEAKQVFEQGRLVPWAP
jgi:DNA polymerase-1